MRNGGGLKLGVGLGFRPGKIIQMRSGKWRTSEEDCQLYHA